MDNSISDILASVTRAHADSASFASDTQKQDDLQFLTRVWIAERAAPELLPYPAELMERVMDRLRKQIENIEDSTAQMDAGTSFGLIVIQTELERFKFLVRSLLRARIAKIDAHPLHTLALYNNVPASQSESQAPRRLDPSQSLLSPHEANYAQLHTTLLERHYHASFLSSFPQKLQRLDDRTGVNMVVGPDLDKAVFVRCLGARKIKTAFDGFDMEDDEMNGMGGGDMYEPIDVSCGFTENGKEGENVNTGTRQPPTKRRLQMRRGDIWIVRWRGVREAVARGECELV